MSDVLTGSAANVTTPLVATIVSLSNNGSGAVRVTTSTPHLFGPSDSVQMSTAVVSGTFTITVIDSLNFDLIGSTYSSTSTGTVSDLSLTPQIQLPTDGDEFSAQLSGLLSAFQGILDRTQFLQKGQSFPVVTTFTTSVTSGLTIPAGVNVIYVDACGGGGGGGGGNGGPGGTGAASQNVTGGSGASGAKRTFAALAVTPGTVYDISIGGNGGGGGGGAGKTTAITGAGSVGSDGGPTYLLQHGTSTLLAEWTGGSGGGTGTAALVATTSSTVWVPGASGPSGSLREGAAGLVQAVTTLSDPAGARRQGDGGGSMATGTGSSGYYGMPSEQRSTFNSVPAGGGVGSGTSSGGAGGGSGGTGGFGQGTVGGVGGAGNSTSSGTGGAGVTAANAADNTGGGGGGGGGGGTAAASGGTGGAGGAGGNGGSGMMIVTWFQSVSTSPWWASV